MTPSRTLIVFLFAALLVSEPSLAGEVPDTKWFEKIDFADYEQCYSDNTEGQFKNTMTLCFDSVEKPVQHVHFPNPGYEHSADCMAYGEYLKRTELHIMFQTGRGICNNGNLLTARKFYCERSGEDELLCTSDWEDADRKWEKGEKPYLYKRIEETPND